MRAFVHNALPSRVVFGAGALDQLGGEIDRLGVRRVLVLCTPRQRALGEEIARRLGVRAAGIFDQAVMHVPVETAVAARAAARSAGADACVAIGGGSTIGLGKAIALGDEAFPGTTTASPAAPPSPSLPILAIPTTYSGSEMTPIYGLTTGGLKKNGRDPRVLPRTVIYDPHLLMPLPAKVAGPSGMNAIAHCVEALYAEDANPITSLMAAEGIRALAASLPRVVRDASDIEARAEALYGAWLAGTCLGAVGMSLHHKLCHTLGGTFNLPHAETHTIVLPHAVAYNRDAAPVAMARIVRALAGAAGGDAGATRGAASADAAQQLFDLARALGAPAALHDIGMSGDRLDEAAQLAMRNPYYNPRPLEEVAIRQLLQGAWEGRRPTT